MLRNLITSTRIIFTKQRAYFFINLLGLATGIGCWLLIFFVLRFETSYDNFHSNANRIYRVVSEFHDQAGVRFSKGSTYPLVRAIRSEYPSVEKAAAIFGSLDDQNLLSTKSDQPGLPEKKFKEKAVFYAEPELFEILNFPFLAGSPATALREPNSIVLSQAMAEKYFGNWQSAIGKTMVYRNTRACKVTGIIHNPPVNTDFPIEIAISFASMRGATSNDWVSSNGNLNTLVKLPGNVTPAQFNSFLKLLAEKNKPDPYKNDIFLLQPLSSIHSDSTFGNYRDHTFSDGLVKALVLIGLFLVVIACVNFINLATAQAIKRSKEVGVRKVLGSSRKKLITQFMTETFVIALLATLLGAILVLLALPFINSILQTQAVFVLDANVLLMLTGLVAGVTILSGIYPAILISGLKPISILKGKLATKSPGGMLMRKGLVVFQFVIAQALIFGTMVVLSQMRYFQHAPLGFDKDAIVNVGIPRDSASRTQWNKLKQDLLMQSSVKNVSFSAFSPLDQNHWETNIYFDNSQEISKFSVDLKIADAEFIKTFGIPIVTGRAINPSDTVREILANESLVKQLGFVDGQQIIGKQIAFNEPRQTGEVVGVVKDFHNYSLDKPIAPAMITTWSTIYQVMNVKIDPSQVKEAISLIKNKWTASFPNHVFDFQFIDEKMNAYYKQEQLLSKLYSIFACIAILISCLGIYGLVVFLAATRLKEIGIRRTLGASRKNIVLRLAGEVMILVAIGIAIATPIAYYFMNDWLQKFTYRIELGAWIFAVTAVCSILIGIITIAYKAIQASSVSPVKVLRNE